MSEKHEVIDATAEEKGQYSSYTEHGSDGHSGEDVGALKKLIYSDVERKLVRKLDLRIIPWITILYFLAVLDRTNVSFAVIMNKDVHHDMASHAGLDANSTSLGFALFYVSYIIFEVPSNIIMARVRPAIWLARIMITWGIVTACFSAVSSSWAYLFLRFLLGAFEAGFWPGLAYYMTLWYRKQEQATRIGWYFLASPMSSAVGSLIAAAVTNMDQIANLMAWQWLFILSGVVTVLMGIATIWYLPDSAANIRGKFLTEEEKTLAVDRLNEEGPAKGFNWADVLAQFKDYKTLLFSWLYFAPVMSVASLAFYLPTLIGSMGHYTTVQLGLMSFPVFFIASGALWIVSWNSDRTGERTFHIVGSAIVGVVGFVLISFVSGTVGRYIGCVLAASGVYATVPIVMALITNNKNGDAQVAACTAIVSSFANIGAVICTKALYGGWPADGPKYIGSNMVNAGGLVLTALAAIALRFAHVKLNKELASGINPDNRRVNYVL